MAPGMRDSLSQGYWPLPSQQSEVQRLKEKNESLVAQLQNAKAMKEGSYYNWIGTYPQLMNLKAKNEELMKKLQDARQEIGHLKDENEHLKAKFSIPSKKASSKAILGVPTVTAVSCTPTNLDDCLTCRSENFQFRHARKDHKLV